MDPLPLGEALHQTLLVLPDPASNVIGDSDVEGPVRLAG